MSAITELGVQSLCLLAGSMLMLGASVLLGHWRHYDVAIAVARAAMVTLAVFWVVWIIGVSTHWKGL